MRKLRRVLLLLGLATLGNTSLVYAQPRDSFHRVTTVASNDRRATYSRDFDTPSDASRDPRLAPRVSRVALASRVSAERRLAASESGVLDHYSAQAEAELQSRGADALRHSTWRLQPEPRPQSPPPPARSHNYYPTLRSGVAHSPPVTLTASSNVLLPRSCCSASRSHAMAGAGSVASAGMAHHR
jgi:hypothetical protein